MTGVRKSTEKWLALGEVSASSARNLVGDAIVSDALAFGGSGGHASVHLAGKVRHDSDYPFDQHELATMVHFVFFHGEDHFKAALVGRGHARAHVNAFGEKIFSEPVEKAGPFFARLSKHRNCFLFAARLFLFRHYALHERGKIEAFESGAAFFGLNLVLKTGA